MPCAVTVRSVGHGTSIANTSLSVRVLMTPLTPYDAWAPSWSAAAVVLPWSSTRSGRPWAWITAKSSSVLLAPRTRPC